MQGGRPAADAAGMTSMPVELLLLLLLVPRPAVPGAAKGACLSGDRQPNRCFSTTPSLKPTALSMAAKSPDACCTACLQLRQCYCWTYTTGTHDADGGVYGCQLKHILQNGSTTSAACVSGNVKSPLPIAAPPVPAPLPPPPDAHSVLFMVVDDLRPQLGSYAAPFPKTPHIDTLAATGLLFDRAYVQWPVCVRTVTASSLLVCSLPSYQRGFPEPLCATAALPSGHMRCAYVAGTEPQFFHERAVGGALFACPPACRVVRLAAV